MYCQSCGTQMAPVLSYCPRCGAGQSLAKIPDAGASSPTVSPDSLIGGIVVTTVVVLGLMLGGLIALKGNGVDEAMIWTFVSFCFTALIGVDAMFLRLLRGLRSAGRREIDTSRLKEAAPRQLGGRRGTHSATRCRALPNTRRARLNLRSEGEVLSSSSNRTHEGQQIKRLRVAGG